jgi:CheY-like chemotaxis protein/MinD-like ATPase involved in chromosome partitioning or flagellar assembly
MADKILVVDDDPDMISLFRLLLINQGYKVIVARNGIEALALAHQELPDLIILDIMLPAKDGFEVARDLHRTPDTATIPILMVTARTSVADKTKGYEVGADIFLTKPVQQMDLQANIKVLLMQRKARKVAVAEHGYVVGVMAPRGGLGVSTTALNLAVAYAKKYNEKVIAAELRPGSGVWADELNLLQVFGLAELIQLDSGEITPTVVDSKLTNTDFRVRLLLSSNLSQEPMHPGGTAQYEAIVSSLSQLASLVVLDIGTFFSDAVPQILNLCSEIIVITEPQQLSIKQTGRMIELLRNTYTSSGTKPLSVISLNHTRSDVTMNVSQIEEVLHRPVALGIPPAMELAAFAARQFLPMSVAQPESLISQQFAKMAEMVKRHRE